MHTLANQINIFDPFLLISILTLYYGDTLISPPSPPSCQVQVSQTGEIWNMKMKPFQLVHLVIYFILSGSAIFTHICRQSWSTRPQKFQCMPLYYCRMLSPITDCRIGSSIRKIGEQKIFYSALPFTKLKTQDGCFKITQPMFFSHITHLPMSMVRQQENSH